MTSEEVWLTTEEVAARLKIPPKTLATWVSANRGPRFAKIGRYRRYLLRDVQQWEQAQLEAARREPPPNSPA
ncbi:helix-turn-helix domain-containing protein [Nocardia salmonicida]|uniref:helix-turn-helix domain-containing protein n=1 Tax=Nocardia salmonicida TaxID=53431 RepID=UPI0033FC584C